MPSESMNQIKKDKAFKSIAVFAMVFLFVVSLLMAIVLPFVDTVGVAEAYSAISSAETEPVYAEGVGKGIYIDYASMKHVSMYDYNGTDTVYGFFYDVSYKFDFDFRENTQLTGSVKNYNIGFREGGRNWYSFTMINAYQSTGANTYARLSITFPYNTSTSSTNIDLMYYSKTDSRFYMTYVLNGFYFDRGFNEVVFKADFKTTEYAKHMYLITETFDDAFSDTILLKQENVRLQQQNEVLTSRNTFLESQYADLEKQSNYTLVNSLNLSTSSVFRSSTQQNLFSDAISVNNGNDSVVGYWYYFSGGTNQDSSRDYLFAFNLGATIVSGSDYYMSFDYVSSWDGNGQINENNEDLYLGVGFVATTDIVPSWRYYPISSLVNYSTPTISSTYDVNYVLFDIFTYDNVTGSYVRLPLRSADATQTRDGLFMSGVDLFSRGSFVTTMVESARQDGYNDGYLDGKVAGKEIGYAEGVKDQGDYSFFGLIGAVFDAPISAFKGLLSFDIFGVDMTAFVSSLFALAIIVVIVKIALGGSK